MQMTPFPAHYQLIYTNFVFSSFSRISCKSSKPYLPFNQALSGFQSGLTWNAVIIQQIVSFSPPLSV